MAGMGSTTSPWPTASSGSAASSLQGIDPRTNSVTRTLPLEGIALPAEDGHNLWLLSIAGTVRLIDPMR